MHLCTNTCMKRDKFTNCKFKLDDKHQYIKSHINKLLKIYAGKKLICTPNQYKNKQDFYPKKMYNVLYHISINNVQKLKYIASVHYLIDC